MIVSMAGNNNVNIRRPDAALELKQNEHEQSIRVGIPSINETVTFDDSANEISIFIITHIICNIRGRISHFSVRAENRRRG